MALTLHYNFAEDKSLAARVGPTLSITRATNGTYRDNTGTIQTAGSGVARFDHNASGTSLGLLVEKAATNIFQYSEDNTTGTYWTDGGACTTSQNQTTAPDGATTADVIGDDGGGGSNQAISYKSSTGLVSASTQYTISCFFKAKQLDWAHIDFSSFTDGPQTDKVYFDLTNGVVGTLPANVDSQGIEDYGSGWYRCWVTFTMGTDTAGFFSFGPADADGDHTVARDGTSDVYWWGAQLEAGAFPTSYIATAGASVTRNKDDVVSATDSSWFAWPGTFYAQLSWPNVPTGDQLAFEADDSTANNRWLIYGRNAGALRMDIVTPGDDGLISENTVITAGATHRIANAANNNDAELYLDGTRLSTGDQTVGTLSGIDRLTLGSTGTSAHMNGHIAEMRFYDERLDNGTLLLLSQGVFPGGLSFVRDIVRDLVRDLVSDLVK